MPATETTSKYEGKKAPLVKLDNQDGEVVSTKDFLGKYVLLYFYPKDMTPGCTKQACALKENMNKLKKLDLQVLGVSCDDVARHKKFADKYELNFPLLADVDKKVVERCGVWVEKVDEISSYPSSRFERMSLQHRNTEGDG